jgi:hypothetical protein
MGSQSELGPDDLGFCRYDQPEYGLMCPYCTNEACAICDSLRLYPGCEHDSMDRHLPVSAEALVAAVRRHRAQGGPWGPPCPNGARAELPALG